jgi:hypothetical protein
MDLGGWLRSLGLEAAFRENEINERNSGTRMRGSSGNDVAEIFRGLISRFEALKNEIK